MDDDKIYLDKEGYKKYLEEIDELKRQYTLNSKEKSEAYQVAVGDGWHDNFGFEQAKRDEDRILGELRRKTADLRKIVIVENGTNNNIVEVNDYVVLNVEYDGNDVEEQTYKIIGSDNGDLFADIAEISLNSPIGKAVYHKPVGYKGRFEVRGSYTKLEIVKIAKTLDQLNEKSNDGPQEEAPKTIKLKK